MFPPTLRFERSVFNRFLRSIFIVGSRIFLVALTRSSVINVVRKCRNRHNDVPIIFGATCSSTFNFLSRGIQVVVRSKIERFKNDSISHAFRNMKYRRESRLQTILRFRSHMDRSSRSRDPCPFIYICTELPITTSQ